MKTRRTLILDKKNVKGLIDIKKAIRAVEEAFGAQGAHGVQMPAKIYLHLDKYGGDFRAMPAYIEKIDRCALKWVNVHPRNKRFNLPTVMAVIVLSDPKNGMPLCIMEGTYATNLRTGAAGAVAAKYLARKNSRIIGMVGCGAQAKTQLLALRELFDIEEGRVWGHEPSYARRFVKDMKKLGLKLVNAKDIKECVSGSDIVVTTTPSRKPIIRPEWLRDDAHINAIGADAIGKQELDARILKKAKIIVDSLEQASHSGEINVPLRDKIISKKDIYADIGEIVSGKKKGRTEKDGLTVFDSTGLAIQDVAIANLIYETAIKKKAGRWSKFV